MKKEFKYEPTVGIKSTNPKDMPEDHSEIPVWNSENWFYEDVIINHKIRSLRRTISEGEAMQFNMMVLENQLIEKLENALKSKNKVIKFSELANK